MKKYYLCIRQGQDDYKKIDSSYSLSVIKHKKEYHQKLKTPGFKDLVILRL